MVMFVRSARGAISFSFLLFSNRSASSVNGFLLPLQGQRRVTNVYNRAAFFSTTSSSFVPPLTTTSTIINTTTQTKLANKQTNIINLPPQQNLTPSYIETLYTSALKHLTSTNCPEPAHSTAHLITHSLGLPSNHFSFFLNEQFGFAVPKGHNLPKKWHEHLVDNIARRGEQEPLQYIVGSWDFHCLVDIICRRPTLIPRSETEELVDFCVFEVGKLRKKDNDPNKIINVLDVGPGSGCISLALLCTVKDLRVTAVDKSSKAVLLTNDNRRKFQEKFMEGSGFFGGEKNGGVYHDGIILCEDGGIKQYYQMNFHLPPTNEVNARLGDERNPPFDIIVSNPPYIPRTKMATLTPDVIVYEDYSALCGDIISDTTLDDGLDIVRDILTPIVFSSEVDRYKVLAEGGVILIEVDESQPKIIKQWLEEEVGGWEVVIIRDFMGKDRFVRIVRGEITKGVVGA